MITNTNIKPFLVPWIWLPIISINYIVNLLFILCSFFILNNEYQTGMLQISMLLFRLARNLVPPNRESIPSLLYLKRIPVQQISEQVSPFYVKTE